ncbi:hypothetical protein D3C71_839710 [compost metagenome]
MRFSIAANAASPWERGRGRSMRWSSAIWPSSIRITRSARATASCTSWVTSSAVKPLLRHRPSMRRCISMRVNASSAPSGSSSSKRRGLCTRARARATRWRWPPDRRAGHSFSRSPRPTRASTSAAALRCPGGRPRATLSCTRFQGKRRESWNMMRVSLLRPATSWPSRRIAPPETDSSPATRRSSVLLPQPLRPTMATNWPGSMTSSVFLSTSRVP